MPKINYNKLFTLRPDGRYQGYWRDAEGKRHTICDKDPKALYDKIQRKAEEANEPKPLLFKEIAEAWKESANVRDNTWTSYESHYNKAVERFGEYKASDISTPDISEYYAELASQDYAMNTIRNVRSVLSNIFQAAMNDRRFSDEIQRNPTRGATMPKGVKKPQRREAPEDEIVEAIRNNADTVDFGLFALLLISTGMRRGEALGLKWDCINLENNSIRVKQQIVFRNSKPIVSPPKTESGTRSVMILPDLKTALEKIPKSERKGFLFCWQDSERPLTQSVYVRRWTNYCKAMGFGSEEIVPTIRRGKDTAKTVFKHNITAHVLRHGYATLLFESDVDPYTAQRLLGHADIETTTAIYTHLRKRQEERSISKLISKVSLAPNKED